MLHRCSVCLLLGTLAMGQAAPPSPAQPPQKNAPARPDTAAAKPIAGTSSIPANVPVITIKGLCEKGPATGKTRTSPAGCQTVIRRAEFEQLVDTLQPNMPAARRRQLASSYATLLLMSHAAQARGLDQAPRFKQMLELARRQILTQELYRELQEQAGKITDQEIEIYYRDNPAAFEQAVLQRIFVPKSKHSEPPKTEEAEAEAAQHQPPAEVDMKPVAEALQARAVAGEDVQQLQKEAFESAGMKATPPNPSLGKIRRSGLPPAHVSVMDLKASAVSPVIADSSGYFIYKVMSKSMLALEQAREEIRGTLRGQKLQDAMQAIQQSATTELNDDYFNTPPPAESHPQQEKDVKPPAKSPASQPK